MAGKIKFNGTGDGEMDKGVHFEGTFSDYTLCGLTLDGDPYTCGGFDVTKEKVDCSICIGIVSFCKTIKNTEMIKYKKPYHGN